MDEEDICSICSGSLHDASDYVICVKEKGLKTFISKSKELNDDKWKAWDGKLSVNFHELCRKRYSAKKIPTTDRKSKIQEALEIPLPPIPKAAVTEKLIFDFANLCFLCGKSIDSRRNQKVSTLTVPTTLRKLLVNTTRRSEIEKEEEEEDDEEEEEDKYSDVIERMHYLINAPDVKASYHKRCFHHFALPPEPKKQARPGRPPVVDTVTNEIFSKVCEYIESSNQLQFTVKELRNAMGEDILENRVLFSKLKEKYGTDIYVSQRVGQQPRVFYKSFNITQVFEDWEDDDSVGDIQRRTVLNVAAQILRKEIEFSKFESDSYPPASAFLSNTTSVLPPLLKLFLNDLLIQDKKVDDENFVKRDNIAHSIISMLRPKSFMSTLQLAVATYVHKKTGSRVIVELLSKLGIGASYHQVQMYEASSILHPPEIDVRDTFVQYVWSKSDHHVVTNNDQELMQCLGGIAIYTPSSSVSYKSSSKRCKKVPLASNKSFSKNRVPIVPYNGNASALRDILILPVASLQLADSPLVMPHYTAYLYAWHFSTPDFPSWRGFMDRISTCVPYSTSHVVCLPFINKPPTKLTTLHTSLRFAMSETKKAKQDMAIVTYDQPLWWKTKALKVEDGKVFVRLGSYHLVMSFLGAIGKTMGGSGLEELWATVYAPESVTRMMRGHAFTRAIRAHILTFSALGMLIIRDMSPTKATKNFIAKFFENWSTEPPDVGDFSDEAFMEHLNEEFIRCLESLASRGPTAKLWAQYMRCAIVLLQFLEAESLADWPLYLKSIENMLPILYASGHFEYAKSAQIYLQDLVELETRMDPEEFRRFSKEGFFSVRRSDKPFSGLSPDMVLDQSLNRFLGSELLRGRKLTPSLLARYLQGLPAATGVMEALEDYCGLSAACSDYQVDSIDARPAKETEDIGKFYAWLLEHEPFKARPGLASLSSGFVADETINCHMAFEEGARAMALVVGKSAEDVSSAASAAHAVRPLSSAHEIFTESDRVFNVDPAPFLQRIARVLRGDEAKTRDALCYELSRYPTSIFDESGFMRRSADSELGKVFTPSLQTRELYENFQYVIDGRWLLYHVLWPRDATFQQICEAYYRHVASNFRNSLVVFDEYNNELIGVESYERYRRREKDLCADVDVTPEGRVAVPQAKFLSNVANKYKFVHLLVKHFNDRGLQTLIATEDADALVVSTAVQIMRQIDSPVAIVGSNVDLLVIAVGLTPSASNVYFLKIVPGQQENVLYDTRSHAHMQPYIIFAHAFGGCDSTSSFFKKAKAVVLSLLEKNKDLQDAVQVFYVQNMTVDELYRAAELFTVNLYKTNKLSASTVNDLRYRIFMSTTKKKASLSSLPPTDAALLEHAKRVYYQIQKWIGNDMSPEDWGWKRNNCMLVPVMTEKPATSEELLDLVFCNCNGNCSSGVCICKKAGFTCTNMCKKCNGESCDNTSVKRAVAVDMNDDNDEVMETEQEEIETLEEQQPDSSVVMNVTNDMMDVDELQNETWIIYN